MWHTHHISQTKKCLGPAHDLGDLKMTKQVIMIKAEECNHLRPKIFTSKNILIDTWADSKLIKNAIRKPFFDTNLTFRNVIKGQHTKQDGDKRRIRNFVQCNSFAMHLFYASFLIKSLMISKISKWSKTYPPF